MGEKKLVPIGEVAVHPLNVRLLRTGENITRLAESIRQRGVEYPLKVIKKLRSPEGYLCYDGGYRLEAAKEAGLKEVWIEIENIANETELIVRSFDSADKTVPLNPMEEAKAFKLILDKLGDVEKVGKAIGRHWKYVKERLALLNLVKKAQKLVLTGEMTWLPAYNLSKHPKHIQGRVLESIEKEAGEWSPHYDNSDINRSLEEILNPPQKDSKEPLKPKSEPKLEPKAEARGETETDWICPICEATYETYHLPGGRHAFKRRFVG